MFQSWMIKKEKVILVWNDMSKYRLNSLVDISLYIVCWLSFTVHWFWMCWCESTLEMWAFQGHSVAEQSRLYLSSIMNANHSSPKAKCFLSLSAPTGSCLGVWVSWRMVWLVRMTLHREDWTGYGPDMTTWAGGKTAWVLDMWRWSSSLTDNETSPQWRWEWSSNRSKQDQGLQTEGKACAYDKEQ